MPDQMCLPGLDIEPALFQPEIIRDRIGQVLGYNLFMAIYPPPAVAERVGLLASELRRQHGLHGQCLLTSRLHMTLHAIASFEHAIPASVIDAARAAASGVACPPFPIVFDRAGSFSNPARLHKNAFVLRCDSRGDAAVTRLRQTLTSALRKSGLRPKPSDTPHMTMLYDQHVVPEHPIEVIRWTATRFALILSHQGLRHHELLGHWQFA